MNTNRVLQWWITGCVCTHVVVAVGTDLPAANVAGGCPVISFSLTEDQRQGIRDAFDMTEATLEAALADPQKADLLLRYLALSEWLNGPTRDRMINGIVEMMNGGTDRRSAIESALARHGTTPTPALVETIEAALSAVQNRVTEQIKFRDHRHKDWVNLRLRRRREASRPESEKSDNFVLPDMKAIMPHVTRRDMSETELRQIIGVRRVSSSGMGGDKYVKQLIEAIRFQLDPPLAPDTLRADLQRYVMNRVRVEITVPIHEANGRLPASMRPAAVDPVTVVEPSSPVDLSTFLNHRSITDRRGAEIDRWVTDLPADVRESIRRILRRLADAEPIERLIQAGHVKYFNDQRLYEIRPLGGNCPHRIFFVLEDGKPVFIMGAKMKDGETQQTRLANEARRQWDHRNADN